MAKKIKGKKPLHQKANDVVQVRSTTYGKHTRAARGSKTTATVNDVFAANAGKTGIINDAAKAVYDVVKFYSGNFREGQLWQNILSRMRKAKSLDFEDLLSSLHKTEINNRYQLIRFGSLPALAVVHTKRKLRIEIEPYMPRLTGNDDCYKYAFITLLFNGKGVCVHHSIQETKWLTEDEEAGKEIFVFNSTTGIKYCLLCLGLQGGIERIATDTFSSRGMMLIYPETN